MPTLLPVFYNDSAYLSFALFQSQDIAGNITYGSSCLVFLQQKLNTANFCYKKSGLNTKVIF